MKSCDEMVHSLLERREQYVVSQKRKKTLIICAVTTLCGVCFVGLLGSGIWKREESETTPADFVKEEEKILAGGNEMSMEDVSVHGDEGGNGIFCGDYWVNDENSSGLESGYESSSSSADEEFSEEFSEETEGAYSETSNLIDVIGMVIVDGTTYVQFEMDGMNYTPDVCIGAANDYEGTYQTYMQDISAKLYTTREDSNVLIVKLSNGGVVTLMKKE